MFSISNLLKSILQIKRITSCRDEFAGFANTLWEYGSSKNKTVLHILDKHSMMKDNFDTMHAFSFMINAVLTYFKKFEQEKLAQI